MFSIPLFHHDRMYLFPVPSRSVPLFVPLYRRSHRVEEGSSPQACVEVLASVVRPEQVDSKVQ